jgi:hypothetical protein
VSWVNCSTHTPPAFGTLVRRQAARRRARAAATDEDLGPSERGPQRCSARTGGAQLLDRARLVFRAPPSAPPSAVTPAAFDASDRLV